MARFLAFFVLLAASPCSAQDTQVFEAAVDSLMAAYGADGPGGVVAVVQSGAVVFAKGYGLADVEHGTPNTPTTPYHLASISKQFTAFAVVLLADQGRLSLDDDVRTYLPELPDVGSTITLRHLATHTSGLRDHWALWAMSGGRMDDVFRKGDLLHLIEEQRELNFEPGTQHLYSNSGYLLLAEVVARVTDRPFGDWMDEHVFTPLGMEDTVVLDDAEQVVLGRATSYRDGDGGLRRWVFNSDVMNLFTTAADLARWLQNFHTAAVGGPAVAQQMLERGVLASGDTLGYALGLYLDRHRGLRRVQHGGVAAGYRTFMATYPELDAGVVALGNVTSFDAPRIADGVAEAFFGDQMTEPDPTGDSVEPGGRASIPPARLDAYVGQYQIMGGPPIRVARDGDGLTVQIIGMDEPPVRLIALSDTLFQIDDPGFDVRLGFRVEPDGAVEGGSMIQGGERPFRRMTWSPAAATLAAYAGRYASDELGTTYDARLEGDRLVLEHARHGTIALTPVEEDVFRGSEWFLSAVAFERDESGAVRGLRMSNDRVRGVRFEKQE